MGSFKWVLYDNDFSIDYQYLFQRNTLYFPLEIKALALSLVRHSVCQIKSAYVSLLIKTLCLSKPKLPSLRVITFVNNFQFNLVLMFVYFVNQALVLNLI